MNPDYQDDENEPETVIINGPHSFLEILEALGIGAKQQFKKCCGCEALIDAARPICPHCKGYRFENPNPTPT